MTHVRSFVHRQWALWSHVDSWHSLSGANRSCSHDLENLEIYRLGRKVPAAIYGEIVPVHLQPASRISARHGSQLCVNMMYPAISPPGTPKTTTALVSLDERESRSE